MSTGIWLVLIEICGHRRTYRFRCKLVAARKTKKKDRINAINREVLVGSSSRDREPKVAVELHKESLINARATFATGRNTANHI